MSLKKNVIANYIGQGWMAVMGIVFAPIYINYLGVESYAIISIYIMCQAWFGLLDMGISPTLNREMSRYQAGQHTAYSIRDLLRTFEIIGLLIGLFIALAISFSARWLAHHWLQVDKLPLDIVVQAITVMGWVLSFRFVETIYHGAIVGMQQQVWLNLVGAAMATLRSVGSVGVIIWIKPSIEIFFLWHGIVSIVTIVAFIILTYYHLPPIDRAARFALEQLKSIWRFASGVMAMTLLGVMLMQGDKIILSRLLSLESFGYYSLAASVGQQVVGMLTLPVTLAFFPRFTEMVAKGDTKGLIEVHHLGAQLISIMVIPCALILAFFSENILALWTNNLVVAHQAAPILTLIVIGTLLNSFLQIPSMLTLAYGKPKFAIHMNFFAVIAMVPALLWATPIYGPLGAAWFWVILNSVYLLLSPFIVYRYFLCGERWRWYFEDMILPAFAALFFTYFFWLNKPDFSNKIIEIIWLFIITIVIFSLSALSASKFRSFYNKRLFV